MAADAVGPRLMGPFRRVVQQFGIRAWPLPWGSRPGRDHGGGAVGS
jgi:hypothetical protein